MLAGDEWGRFQRVFQQLTSVVAGHGMPHGAERGPQSQSVGLIWSARRIITALAAPRCSGPLAGQTHDAMVGRCVATCDLTLLDGSLEVGAGRQSRHWATTRVAGGEGLASEVEQWVKGGRGVVNLSAPALPCSSASVTLSRERMARVAYKYGRLAGITA